MMDGGVATPMREDDHLELGTELYRSIVEHAPVAILVTDAEGRFVAVNRAAEEQTGYSRAQLIGMRFSKLVQVESSSQAEEDFQRSALGVNTDEEYRIRRANGEPYWAQAKAMALPDGRCVAFSEDVTERRAREQELHLLKTAVAQAPEPIMITDVDGAIQCVNPAFERVSGYSADEVVGRNPRMLSAKTEGPEFYRALWAQLTAGQVWQGRFTNRRKDGSLYVEDTAIAPVCDAEGSVVSYVALKRDVTEKLKLEDDLRQAKKMEALGRLAGGVAHDFNNLLTVILSSTALALEDLSGEAGVLRADLESALSAARRAEALTQQLLSFSRRQLVQPETLNLNHLVEGLLDMATRLIGEHITVSTELGAELWPCKADAGKLEQVIINLVVNARDAMPEGGTLTIATSNVVKPADSTGASRTVGDFVRLRIGDEGCGMDANTKEQAFEPFFTTKKQGHGTGFGLSTVLGVVEQCGGHVELTSEVGRGSVFDLYFPRGSELRLEHPALASARPRVAPAQETVLVVEDEDGVRAVAVRVLERAGHRVLAADNGLEGLRLAESEPRIDLLLSDVVMPGMNGVGVAVGVKARHPHAAVLFMSGYPDADIDRFLEDHERSAMLQKPFSPQLLLSAVERALDGPLSASQPVAI